MLSFKIYFCLFIPDDCCNWCGIYSNVFQAAHVGIGVSGVEGLQAACASDFAIAQVQFLYVL